MRQTSGAVVCAGCGRLVDVADERCPYCGHWRPGMFGYSTFLRDKLGDLDVTKAITGFCIVVYVLALLLDPRGIFRASGVFSILAPTFRSLLLLGMTGRLTQDGADLMLRARSASSVFSAIFLHGGILHIFFNLMWVRQLGPFVEEHYGSARTFVLFVLSGAGGFVASNLVSGAPTVGASGSIFGLLAATVAYGRRRGGSLGQAVSQQALMWSIMVFAMGFLMPSVNNWAHGGGFVSGYLVSLLLLPHVHRPESARMRVLALGLALLCIGAILWSVITIFPRML